MAGAVTVTIEGLDELEAAVRRMAAALDGDVAEAMLAGANAFEGRARQVAPRQSGRLVGSMTLTAQGSDVLFEITATRSSPRYPAYPYPVRVERQQGFLARAVSQAASDLDKITDEVGDRVVQRWGA